MNLNTVLNSAFERMKIILFQPFNLGKWFTLGFSAWLASFIHDKPFSLFGGGGGWGGNDHSSSSSAQAWLDTAKDGLAHAWAQIPQWSHSSLLAVTGQGGPNYDKLDSIAAAHTWLLIIILGVVCLLVLALVVVLCWLGCRGQFMFFDNLLHNRSEIAKPWRAFKRRGNSLFLFNLCAMLAMLLATLIVAGLLALLFLLACFGNIDFANFHAVDFAKHWPQILGAVAVLAIYLLVIGAWYCLYLEFSVPIMYFSDCGATQAFRKMGQLFWQQPLNFLLYLLIRVALDVLFFTLSVAVCCICCLTMLPYLNVVTTMPLRTFRFGFTMEFLGQLDPAFRPPSLPVPPPIPSLVPVAPPPIPGTNS